MKIISFYLPQFHQVPENDEWWGKGFTEWMAVKDAKPLFDNHEQPRVPLDNNYYNLLEKQTMMKQADLMQKYNVFGQCFYHYWFKNGRKILEKPAENLLEWKDINMPFCFSWANESWIRSWSSIKNAGGNDWCPKFDKKIKNNNGMLLEQDYGSRKDWEEHFYYLLPFFKDERYIKLNNSPVFIFYRSNKIDCLVEMVTCWRSLAKKEGFADLYLIGRNEREEVLDATFEHQPSSAFNISICLRKDKMALYDYQTVCKNILFYETNLEKKMYYCAFSGYDDTPRRGENGVVVKNISPKIFEDSLTKILKFSENQGNEFVFINAWNEWGEGMYLEPDEKNKYSYLQSIKNSMQNYKNCELPSASLKLNLNKKFIIFGTGEFFSKKEKLLQKFSFMDNVECFLDNDPKKNNTAIYNKKIFLPEKFSESSYDYILLMSNKYEEKMKEQLIGLKVPKEKILTWVEFAEKYLFQKLPDVDK